MHAKLNKKLKPILQDHNSNELSALLQIFCFVDNKYKTFHSYSNFPFVSLLLSFFLSFLASAKSNILTFSNGEIHSLNTEKNLYLFKYINNSDDYY